MLLQYYLEQLDYKNMPLFLRKYFECPSLNRLMKVGYFCGMDFASKSVYDFSEYISRFAHSLTTSLLTYKVTKNKTMTVAALFHDVVTPCFSHVIDYMNEDYEKQESTEELTEDIIKNDKYLLECLKEDNIDVDDVIDFKKFSIVDNDRPKCCADRLDGVILTGIGWTKNISKDDIKNIISDIRVFKNEENEDEIGFNSRDVVSKMIDVSKSIDIYCHTNEDNYMMQLLATITKLSIDKGYITYDDLYRYNELELFNILKSSNDKELLDYIRLFENIDIESIPKTDIPNVKVRVLKPLVKGKRYD